MELHAFTLLLMLLSGIMAYSEHAPQGLTIADVQDLISAVENDAESLLTELGTVSTLCQVANQKLTDIVQARLGALALKNTQQNRLAQLFEDQTKSLQHRVGDVFASVRSVVQRVEETSSEHRAAIDLNGLINTSNQQENLIINLTESIRELKDDVISSLDVSVDEVESRLNDVREDVIAVTDFVSSIKCEYGSFSACPHDGIDVVNVTFKTVFNAPPTVSMSLVGFSAHLDARSHHGYNYEGDVISIDKSVTYVDESGFLATVFDLSTVLIDPSTTEDAFGVTISDSNSQIENASHVLPLTP